MEEPAKDVKKPVKDTCTKAEDDMGTASKAGVTLQPRKFAVKSSGPQPPWASSAQSAQVPVNTQQAEVVDEVVGPVDFT